MDAVLVLDDGSEYAARLVEELRELHTDLRVLERAGEIAASLDEGVSAVLLVSPHQHTARAVRHELEKAGGLVSRTPVIAALGERLMLGERNPLEYVDDFMVNPAGADELEARVAVLTARRGHQRNVIASGELLVNLDAHRVYLGGKPVDFTYKEFELLKMMAATPGRAYSRDELLRSVWGYDYFGGTRTVDVHIRRLRAKIETSHRYIETVHGVGYRFVG